MEIRMFQPNREPKIELVKYPTEEDWLLCKKCTLVTVGKDSEKDATAEFKRKLLNARHSPIRELKFVFRLTDVPYWVSTHFVRHTHAQPYVKTQRNDRQDDYDRNSARQDAPVSMMWSMNAEELMVICNKRLCMKASPETRELVNKIKELVEEKCPEFKGFLVPMCQYQGRCHEIEPCGKPTLETMFTALYKSTDILKQSINVIEDDESISGKALKELMEKVGI